LSYGQIEACGKTNQIQCVFFCPLPSSVKVLASELMRYAGSDLAKGVAMPISLRADGRRAACAVADVTASFTGRAHQISVTAMAVRLRRSCFGVVEVVRRAYELWRQAGQPDGKDREF
jgi:hypothetical protein